MHVALPTASDNLQEYLLQRDQREIAVENAVSEADARNVDVSDSSSSNEPLSLLYMRAHNVELNGIREDQLQKTCRGGMFLRSSFVNVNHSTHRENYSVPPVAFV